MTRNPILTSVSIRTNYRMMRVQNKLEKASACLEYFTTRQWAFADDNVKALCSALSPEDQNTFDFDVTNIDWDAYIESYVLGIRRFLFKESPDTLPKSRKTLRRWVKVLSLSILVIKLQRVQLIIYVYVQMYFEEHPVITNFSQKYFFSWPRITLKILNWF